MKTRLEVLDFGSTFDKTKWLVPVSRHDMSIADEIMNRPTTIMIASASLLRLSRSKKLSESSRPTEGIYYCVPSVGGGWEPFVYRFDDFPPTDHTDLWEEHVAPLMAYRWAKSLKRNERDLEADLKLLTYACPRGRIVGPPWKVLNGNDTPSSISKSTINRAFSLPTNTVWEDDHHEHAQADDRDQFRRIMKLKETWPAV